MALKQTVENHPVIWTLGIIVAAFMAGIGAYDGILRISRSQVVPSDTRILADDEKAIARSDYDELFSASTDLIRANDEIGMLTEKLVQYQSQHEFFVRYLRYETSRQILNEQFNEENSGNHQLAEKMFVDLILKWWKQQQELDGNLVLNQQVIRKGLDPTNSRIAFADGTIWPIPTSIKLKVLQQE